VTNHNNATLFRVIGRWSLTALVINSMIGSAVFGLPSQIAALTGRASPIAVIIAGGGIGIVMACYAELASYFTDAGGPYLYGREAFGRLMGIEIGWMLWLAQLSACAANGNLFVIYLAQFWHEADKPLPRFVVLTVLVGFLALINYRGVRGGARVSDLFTVAKLLPLVIVVVTGLIYLLTHPKTALTTSFPSPANHWRNAILLMFFAYGGFETALVPMSEAKNPRRDAVFALFTSLIVVTSIYTLVQWIVVATLVDPASSARPLADVATLTLGRGGAAFVALGALVACYGYLSAKILGVPRITFALAQEGDFPKIFGAVHPRFQTPYFSILIFAALTWALALVGNFSWNVTLSAFARLFYYGAGCAGLLILRRKRPGEALFQLPGGVPLAIIGILICLVLVTRIDMGRSLILFGVLLAALLNWLWVSRKNAS
jgi:basic amino acid/polyamine antiporter, APA family